MATSLTKKPRSKKVKTRTFRKKTYRKKRIKRKKSSRKKMRGGVPNSLDEDRKLLAMLGITESSLLRMGESDIKELLGRAELEPGSKGAILMQLIRLIEKLRANDTMATRGKALQEASIAATNLVKEMMGFDVAALTTAISEAETMNLSPTSIAKAKLKLAELNVSKNKDFEAFRTAIRNAEASEVMPFYIINARAKLDELERGGGQRH